MDRDATLLVNGGAGKPRASIRWRLALALAGASIFTLVVVGVLFYVFVGSYVVDRQKTEILNQAVLTAEQLDSLGIGGPGAAVGNVLSALLKNELKALPANAGIVVFEGTNVLGRAGTVPARLGTVARLRIEALAIGENTARVAVVKPILGATGGRNQVVVAVAPFALSSSPHGLVVITLAVADAVTARQGIVRILLLSGAIALVVAIIMGLGLGSWLARPLRRLSVAARGMAQGDYGHPVSGSYPGEVEELATKPRGDAPGGAEERGLSARVRGVGRPRAQNPADFYPGLFSGVVGRHGRHT